MHRGKRVYKDVTRRRARVVFGDRPVVLWCHVIERAGRSGVRDSRKGFPVEKVGSCLRSREVGCTRNDIEPCEVEPIEVRERQCLIGGAVVREAAFFMTRAPDNSVASTDPRNRFRDDAPGAESQLQRFRRASDQGLFVPATIIDARCAALNQTATMGVAQMGSYAGTSNEIGTSDCEIRYFEPINPRFGARYRNLVEPEQFKITDGLRQPRSMGLVAIGLEQSTWLGGAMGFRKGALIRVEGLQRNRVLSILAERPVRRGTAYREREKCVHPVVCLEGTRPTLRAVVGLWEAPRSRTAKEKA